ncbi:hypothetical protein [Chryseobacterium wanjuense]
MKNKIIKISIAASLLLGTGLINIACNTDNLEDVQNLGAFDTNNFFRNEQECFFALVGTYDPLRKYAGGFENMVTFSMQALMIFMQEEEVRQTVQGFKDCQIIS